MLSKIGLNNGWRLTWSEFNFKFTPEIYSVFDNDIIVDADVPGDAHLDLMRQGIIPDLYTSMNLDHARWTEYKDWWYRKEFDTPKSIEGKRAYLVFRGLDTYGTIWLNERLLGRTDNMFLRYEFDVTDILRRSGKNELIVKLGSPILNIPCDFNHEYNTFSSERIFCRKAQMSFGWDIAPRLLTIGIWRPVELLLVDKGRITNVCYKVGKIKNKTTKVDIRVEVEWLSTSDGSGCISGKIGDCTWEIPTNLQPGKNVFAKQALLEDVQLWWPMGYGEQKLYDTEVAFVCDGQLLDKQQHRIGVRDIELIQEPQPSGATSFRFRCNGKDLLITGFNWTPLDAVFAAVTDEKITRTLEKLAGIDCNMLRMWGGGIYENQHFYNECDRLGIMVWQDFMMSCAWYPQTDRFTEQLKTEVSQVIRDLRNHCCIALWCGDNEIDLFFPTLASKNRINRDTLPSVCKELVPETIYLPSSPFSPSDPNPRCHTQGDAHHYDHGGNYKTGEMWNIVCRFMSEFGHLSLPSMEVISRYFPEESRWPLTTDVWKYHGANTNKVMFFRGPEKILEALETCGKPAPDNIEDTIIASQQLQAEALCALIERYCNDPEFGGFLLWNVADCWPQQSDSVIDYLGISKLVFAKLGPLFRKIRKKHEPS